MKRNKIDLHNRFEILERPLILDGAVGSLLCERTLSFDKTLWSSIINITNPEAVINLHKEYIQAGADIITTNTFRTNPNAYAHSKLNITHEEFVKQSIGIAIESIRNKEIIIAGSNAPAEDCYQVERIISQRALDYNHKAHIELLWENDCDIIWNETQSHWDEIEIICKFCSENSIQYVLNLFFDEDIKILSGEPLKEVIDFITDYLPVAIGFNCIQPDLLKKYFTQNVPPQSWGFYFNCGSGNIRDEKILCGISPEDYINNIEEFIKLNPLFVGSCCGSSPNHTKAIKDYFLELYRN